MLISALTIKKKIKIKFYNALSCKQELLISISCIVEVVGLDVTWCLKVRNLITVVKFNCHNHIIDVDPNYPTVCRETKVVKTRNCKA